MPRSSLAVATLFTSRVEGLRTSMPSSEFVDALLSLSVLPRLAASTTMPSPATGSPPRFSVARLATTTFRSELTTAIPLQLLPSDPGGVAPLPRTVLASDWMSRIPYPVSWAALSRMVLR